jgi:hypothetical protein
MSTLKVSEILHQDGTTTSEPSIPALDGRFAQAWVNFNGSGTVEIRDSYNISSITDNGRGNYTLTFNTAMNTADYGTIGMCCQSSDGDTSTLRGTALHGPSAQTTTSVRLRTMNGLNTVTFDPQIVGIAIFGGK